MKTLLLFLVFFNWSAWAQSYHPDQITIQGQTYDYRYHHMEQYFRSFPNKRPVPLKDSTLIHRGYIAEFEIGNDLQFYLKDIKIPLNQSYDHLISKFQEISGPTNQPLFLYWVNGLFEVGMGAPIDHKDSLFPTYNKYMVLEITKGKVSRTNIFTHKQLETFKSHQWNIYSTTPAFKKVYESLRLSGLPESEIKNHIYFHILFYSKKNFLKK